jgi:hypothetical protein
MQSILRTVRIQSGLYISLDGMWKIRRATEGFPPRKVWIVSRMMDMQWTDAKRFSTLSAARMFVTENVQGWWD